jgi:hypothetical protein
MSYIIVIILNVLLLIKFSFVFSLTSIEILLREKHFTICVGLVGFFVVWKWFELLNNDRDLISSIEEIENAQHTRNTKNIKEMNKKLDIVRSFSQKIILTFVIVFLVLSIITEK